MIKYGLRLVVAVAAITIATTSASASEQQSQGDVSVQPENKGKLTIDARLFYFDRTFDLPDKPPARAFTGGGIAKYETAALNNFKAALGFYGSFSLFGIVDRELSIGTDMLQSNTDDIAFMGEAYVDYDSGQNQVKAGRQRLVTPLINDRDFRMLPSVFEALVYRNHSFEQTTLEAGYLYSESGFGSSLSDFSQQTELWGEDGLGYVYGSTRISGAALRGQFVGTLENSGLFQNFSYADVNLPVSKLSGTHIQGQLGGTGYQTENSATMYGLKLSTRISDLGLAAVYNRIRGNKYSAVEAGPLYSDWQQGYANYEPSEALGVQLGYDLSDDLFLSVGYVDIESVEGDAFNLDTYVETVFDLRYEIDGNAHIRIRYSDKNQAEDSDREDRQDFRVIFYYDLS